MFNKKKEAAPPIAADRQAARKLIEKELAAMEELKDGKLQEAYIQGLADMAHTLGAITLNERADYRERAYTKAQEIKAKGQPVYKKSGVYEYRGYYILKDLAIEGSACWCVKKMGTEELIAKDLKYNDAVKVVDGAQ